MQILTSLPGPDGNSGSKTQRSLPPLPPRPPPLHRSGEEQFCTGISQCLLCWRRGPRPHKHLRSIFQASSFGDFTVEGSWIFIHSRPGCKSRFRERWPQPCWHFENEDGWLQFIFLPVPSLNDFWLFLSQKFGFFWGGGMWDIKDFKSRKMYHVGENFLKEFSWRWTFRWISLVHFTVLIWILEVVSIWKTTLWNPHSHSKTRVNYPKLIAM